MTLLHFWMLVISVVVFFATAKMYYVSGKKLKIALAEIDLKRKEVEYKHALVMEMLNKRDELPFEEWITEYERIYNIVYNRTRLGN